jgi:hypothetical protein
VNHGASFERAVEATRERFACTQTHLVRVPRHSARVRGLAAVPLAAFDGVLCSAECLKNTDQQAVLTLQHTRGC